MTTPSSPIETDLASWLTKQPLWLQYGAQALIQGKTVGPQEIIAFAKMARNEALSELVQPDIPAELGSFGSAVGGSVRLLSLSKATGIGRLNPRSPLDFGAEKVSVIFGSNGSGKSSYVRILKHACGARDKGELHPNAFDKTAASQGCSISFTNGAGLPTTVDWKPESGVVQELSTIDIFDSHCGQSYIASEGQTTYEPRLLVFLSALATLSDQVAAKLADAIAAKVKALPSLPTEHSNTSAGMWYGNLSAQITQEAVGEACDWNEQYEQELAALAKYLAERSPKERAKELETRKGIVNGLIVSLKQHITALSEEVCRGLMARREAAKEKQKTAELAAKSNLQDAVLNGVGTRQWLSLWSIARTYSAEVAYTLIPYPNTGEGSRCVLCQQELSPSAKKRLLSFDQYVANEASTAAKAARTDLENAIRLLPTLPNDETLEAKGAGAGLDDNSVALLKGFYTLLRVRLEMLQADNILDTFGASPDATEWLAGAQAVADDYAAKANQFLEGFNEQERASKSARQKELTSRKWIHGQKAAIDLEVARLGQVAILERARNLAGTRAISVKKGLLAEALITPAYIDAFNSELKRLGAKGVRVALVKTRVERGAILHQVKLRDAVRNTPIDEVLSEGENRIVCIAAFLADVSSKPNESTFVFDDPISSLDLDFEESVVRRLVELSSSRQVIIFTHRLSLLGMVQDYAKKAMIDVRVVNICTEPWGAGEPGDISIETAKPKAALNDRLPKRVLAARAVLEKAGNAAYKEQAQSICTEIRKLVERIIELELLADVIQRHRRAINTQGKLEKLSDIEPSDCALLDEMMTKYSRYEHAQSPEAPVELPLPDELDEDLTRLKVWREGLDARRK